MYLIGRGMIDFDPYVPASIKFKIDEQQTAPVTPEKTNTTKDKDTNKDTKKDTKKKSDKKDTKKDTKKKTTKTTKSTKPKTTTTK
jgi:hypothetical protein